MDSKADLQPSQTKPEVETSFEKQVRKQKKISPSKALRAYQEEQKANGKEKKAQLKSQKLLELYIAPLVVLGVFGAILFLLVIPTANRVIQGFNSFGALAEELELVDRELASLSALANNSTSIASNLAAIEAIVPEGRTEVANFQRQVRQLAEEDNNVNVLEASTGEQILKSTTSETGLPTDQLDSRVLAIVEIPSTFVLEGTLPQLQGFIEDIKNINDFVIIGQMQLRTDEGFNSSTIANVDAGQWKLTITLVKYQFQVPDSENQLEQVYGRVPATAEVSPRLLSYVLEKVNDNN